jgi:acyl-CoA synthetase (AMP-forming)/AMP-acid ligase II
MSTTATPPAATGVLAPPVDAQAAGDPDGAALRTLTETWTWSELARTARHVARALDAIGVEPGELVAIGTGTRPEFAAAFCGIGLAQAIPVLVDTRSDEWRRQLGPVVAAVVWDAPRDSAAEVRVERLGRPPRPDRWAAISHVLSTSGTAGEAKGIVWSKARFEGDLAARRRSFGDHPCLGLLTPLEHSMGFRRLATSLYGGIPLGFVPDSFTIPRAFADMERLGVTHVYCTPTHVELMLRAALPPPRHLRALDVSAGRVAPESLRALADLLAGVRVSCSYGLTEVGTLTLLEAPEVHTKAHTVGVPGTRTRIPINHGTTIEIRDDAGQAVAPGATGEIVVTVQDWTPIDGYLRADATLAARFAAGVLRTGDRGAFDGDGFLCLAGRNEEMLKVAGHRVATPGLEERLRALLATDAVCVVGVGTPVVGEVPAALYVPTAHTPAHATLARLGRQHLPRYEAPRWYLARRELPRTSLGKVRRAVAQEEAQRWVARWPSTLPVDARLWPAADVPAAAAPPRVVVVLDGVPPAWRPALEPQPVTPLDRELCFATREPALAPVAWAALRDSTGPWGHGLRVLRGPVVPAAHEGDARLLRALVDELAALAGHLPGPPAAALVAQPPPALRPTYVAAGWVALPDHKNVLVRRLDDAAPLHALWPPIG